MDTLHPVLYQPSIEQIKAGEQAAIEQLETLFVGMATTVAEQEGHAFRAVHAKGQGLLKGRLDIFPGLSEELAQGLFAQPGSYRVVMRFSSPPAEQLPDSVSTPRAVALKVLDIEAEHLPGFGDSTSQDFLMVNGPTFSAPDPAGFVAAVKLLAATTERMPRTKRVISASLRGAEAIVEAFGGQSGKLKAIGGEPQRHPLGETYFGQVPYRYGAYIAKFSLAPLSPELLELEGQPIASVEDAQREAIASYFGGVARPVEWVLRVQLCRDLEHMPIEDASVEWPEELSPWQPVAKLSFDSQSSWDLGTQSQEDALAFAPWNGLVAHQPLGGVNRARRAVMEISRAYRSGFNRCPIREPR